MTLLEIVVSASKKADPQRVDMLSSFGRIFHIHSPTHSTGHLFCNYTSGRPMSTSQVRAAMTSVIKAANPGSIPKAHDVRKIASSYAFFHDMSFDNMSISTGWSSSQVFIKHYLKEVEDLQQVCVSLGGVFTPTSTTSK